VACVALAKVECLLAAAGKGLILSVATPGQGGQQCQQCGSDIVIVLNSWGSGGSGA